ncbi:MAG: hypothetical protein AB4368_33010 [Xenococcaceae cyanobacterium]
MNTNKLKVVSSFCTSLAIAIALVIVGKMNTAQAQNAVVPPNLNQSSVNGLFTPTSADRFFEEGRRKFEREIEILTHPEDYYNGAILQIETIDMKVMDEMGETKTVPNFPDDSLQQ